MNTITVKDIKIELEICENFSNYLIDKNGKKIKLDTIYTDYSLDFLKSLPNDSVNLIITSPPYNNFRNKRHENDPIKNNRYTQVDYDVYSDSVPEHIYQQDQIEIINEMIRVLKTDGTICYIHKERRYDFGIISPLSWISKSNAIHKQTIIWDRLAPCNIPNPNTGMFDREEEYIYLFGKTRKLGKWNKEFARYGSVWKISRNKKNYGHPATFPEEIPRRCIEAFSNPGDIILDPYSGTGTTAVVAKKMNRKYLGVDISENYNNIARNRLNKQKSMKDQIEFLNDFINKNPLHKDHDFYLFTAKDKFIEEQDGRYRKTIKIEKIFKISPNEKSINLMYSLCLQKTDSKLYNIWLPKNTENDKLNIDFINKYKNQDSIKTIKNIIDI